MTGKQRPATGATQFDAAATALPEGRGPQRGSWREALDQLMLRLHTRTVRPFHTGGAVLDRYVGEAPSLQNAIDMLGGWSGSMPPETGLRAGQQAFHLDVRLDWLLRECFDVRGRAVLELGPLEGFHTAMLERHGAAEITAIEANAAAFLRCLVTKEALKLNRSSFLLGDFMRWFDGEQRRYDLIVGSGVLYHSDDPVRLLERLGAATDALYLWTHVVDEGAMPRGDKRRQPLSGKIEVRRSHGVGVRLHERSYYRSWRHSAFNGGLQDRHFWIDRGDLFALLGAMGFDKIMVAHEEPEHRHGPSLSIFAQRAALPDGGNSGTPGGEGGASHAPT